MEASAINDTSRFTFREASAPQQRSTDPAHLPVLLGSTASSTHTRPGHAAVQLPSASSSATMLRSSLLLCKVADRSNSAAEFKSHRLRMVPVISDWKRSNGNADECPLRPDAPCKGRDHNTCVRKY